MDTATTALVAPWTQLGIAGSVVIALAYVCYIQWQHIKDITRRHLADVKSYADKYGELLIENSKTQTALARAIERLGDKIR